MRNDIQPSLADFGPTFHAGSERSFVQALKGGIDAKQFLLPRLAKFVEHLIIVSFDCPILIVPIARLLEILFDRRQPAQQFAPTVDENCSVLGVTFCLCI